MNILKNNIISSNKIWGNWYGLGIVLIRISNTWL